jgi:DMSO/TMAO reductase YedYZ heme-binding membrane subunit
MIKILIDLIQFLYSALPLIMSVAVFVLSGILLSKSIKRHAKIYYIVLGIPFALVSIPFIGRMFGFEIFNFGQIPFLGGILRDYIHMGTFGFPLLIIIMYTGALNPKIEWVKKLFAIRKELSIISGFPVLTHSLIRVANTFPGSLRFFTNNEEYMSTAKVTSELGAGISNFSFVLGIVLLVVFIPLWVTSFDSIHKRMGNIKWKKLQKWSYVLYVLLFIHAMGIQVGGLLNPRGGGNPQRAAIENTQTNVAGKTNASENGKNDTDAGNTRLQANPERRGRGDIAANADAKRNGQSNGEGGVQSENKQNNQGEVTISRRGGHVQSFGFSDINISSPVKRYIHIISLILIFGSYLYLRLRKARQDREKRKS